MPQERVELAREAGISARLEVRALELLHGGHERLGNEPSPVRPVVAAGVRVAPSKRRNHVCPSNAAKSARSLPGSFTPGDASTPDETSIPKGSTCSHGLAHVLRSQSASEQHRPSLGCCRRHRPIHGRAGPAAALRVVRIEQHGGAGGHAVDGRRIEAGRNGDRFDHPVRQAPNHLRRFVPVQLDRAELHQARHLDDVFQRLIDEDADRHDPRW